DGSIVNTWKDPWFPLHSPRPPKPDSQTPPDGPINMLFNNTNTGLNEAKSSQTSAQQGPRQMDNRNSLRTKTPWQRPHPNWFKCNYDGSFIDKETRWKSGWKEIEFSLPLRVSYKLCNNAGTKGDCQRVVNAVTRKSLHFKAHNWIRDIRWWATQFDEVKFTWISRVSNKAADILA
ncbi:unnamed protein product, partial [Thlaspi arvense]